jgi:glycerol kinase
MTDFILAIDQGTTSTRAIVFDKKLNPRGSGQKEFKQFYPASGWVEHDAEEIWKSVLFTVKAAIKNARVKVADIKSIGITNQRETTVIWDRQTGKPIHKAIVWQDRRTAEICKLLKTKGLESTVTQKTGLLLDPYFSGTKVAWLLDNIKGARARAINGELCFGTIDSFLIWRLTGGKVHATDATNACRTLLYNIHNGDWDDELLTALNVPRAILPVIKDCAADFGVTEKKLFGAAIPIGGVAGDQHAAAIGQACFEPGMMKSTYGTGCFAIMNTGDTPVTSHNRLLTTLAYQLNGKRTYALEGAIFIAGAAVQWLRDGIKIVKSAKETGTLARASDPSQHVYLVPAFVGLGAPYWNADARGALFGLTRATTNKELSRAALESVCYQTRDLLEAMKKDWGAPGQTVLRVDGGMTASDWTMQNLADILDAPVDRPTVLETTALGAAYLAGLQAGLLPPPQQFAKSWKRDKRFTPKMKAAERDAKYAGWKDAVRKLLS